MPYSGAPAQNPVPEQSQAAFMPSQVNQYPANPSAIQPADPNMGMNALAKTNIPESTQVRVYARLSRISICPRKVSRVLWLNKLFSQG